MEEPMDGRTSDSTQLEKEIGHTLRCKTRKIQCQVEGCSEPIPRNKTYHKRYRICVYHATLHQMVLLGRHVRFCQQCGRFQPLSDFNGDRKSCRNKLESHNRRRKQARWAGANQMTHIPSQLAPEEDPLLVYNNYNSNSGKISEILVNSSENERINSSMDDGESGRRVHHEEHGINLTAVNRTRESNSIDALDAMLDEVHPQNVLALGDADYRDLEKAFHEFSGSHPNVVDLDHNQQGVSSRDVSPPQSIPTREHQLQRQHMDEIRRPSLDAPAQVKTVAQFMTQHSTMAPPVTFRPPLDLTRITFKLFNVHPNELPESIQTALSHLVTSSTISANIRAGCTHITMDVLMSQEESVDFLKFGAKGPNGAVLAQIGGEVCIIRGDAPVTVNLSDETRSAPHVTCVTPCAAVPGHRVAFRVLGSGFQSSCDMVVCRHGAALPDLEVVRIEDLSSNGPGQDAAYIDIVMPHIQAGLHFVEVQRGSLLSSAAPIVVVDDELAVAELRELETDARGIGDGSAAAVSSFLRCVGVVLGNKRDDGNNCAALARSIAAICAGRGWRALLRLVLPFIIGPGETAGYALRAIKSLSSEGFSLPHQVALSRVSIMVPVLSQWAAERGCGNELWEGDEPSIFCKSGLTPLHLAALINDNAAMASALTSLYKNGLQLWRRKGPACHQGAPFPSPIAFATLCGNTPIVSWLKKQGVKHETLNLTCKDADHVDDDAEHDEIVHYHRAGSKGKQARWSSLAKRWYGATVDDVEETIRDYNARDFMTWTSGKVQITGCLVAILAAAVALRNF